MVRRCRRLRGRVRRTVLSREVRREGGAGRVRRLVGHGGWDLQRQALAESLLLGGEEEVAVVGVVLQRVSEAVGMGGRCGVLTVLEPRRDWGAIATRGSRRVNNAVMDSQLRGGWWWAGLGEVAGQADICCSGSGARIEHAQATRSRGRELSVLCISAVIA